MAKVENHGPVHFRKDCLYATMNRDGDLWAVYLGFSPDVSPKNYVVALLFEKRQEAIDHILNTDRIYVPFFTCGE